MKSFIPKDLKEWNINVIDNLIQLPNIESETFDFKGHCFDAFKELHEDICAMANTIGGYLVIGIDEIKDNRGNTLKFRKKGFDKFKDENNVENYINNALSRIEPLPKFEKLSISDTNLFYPLLKISSEEIDKPYFVKDKGICYVRVNSSSKPASRNTILTLFSNTIKKRNDIEKLKTGIKILIEQILFTSDRIEEVDPRILNDTIIPVNLDLFRSLIVSTDWFFLENKLYGGHMDNSIESGLYYNLNKIERLNLYIENYNKYPNFENRKTIKNIIRFWNPKGSELKQIIGFLTLLISKCDGYLSKTNYMP
jgi:hypothetical protein